jgi:hypothetical protein
LLVLSAASLAADVAILKRLRASLKIGRGCM